MTPQEAHNIAAIVLDDAIYDAARGLVDSLVASESTTGIIRYIGVQGDRLSFMATVLSWDRDHPDFRSGPVFADYNTFYVRRLTSKFIDIFPEIGRERIEPIMMSIKNDIRKCLAAVDQSKLAFSVNSAHPMSQIYEEIDSALPISGVMAPKIHPRALQLETTYGKMFRAAIEAIQSA